MRRKQLPDEVLEVTVRRRPSAPPHTESKVRITIHLPASLLGRLDRARARIVEAEAQPVKRSTLVEAILSDYLSKEGF